LRISAAEARLAVARGLRREGPVDVAETVSGYVSAWAARTPDAVAVSGGTGDLTYAELARAASALCRELAGDGVRPGTVVAAAGPRSAYSVVLLLALESLGAAYLPVDAAWPAVRLADVIRRAGAVRVICYHADPAGQAGARVAEAAQAAGVPVLQAPDLTALVASGEPPGLRERTEPAEARYVYFTSGTTGVPKGAITEHQGMVNHLWAKIADLELAQGDVLALTAPLTFDIAIWQMVAPLLVGGRIAVLDDRDTAFPRSLVKRLDERGVTVVELVPTVLEWLADAPATRPLHRLRGIVSTGEELTAQLAARLLARLPEARVVNAYGFTETSDDVTHHLVRPGDLTQPRLPVGAPVLNTALYVLVNEGDGEDDWRAAHPGESGELFVGGLAPGLGYLGDELASRSSFFHDVLDPGSPTGRLYRTGDGVVLDGAVVRYLGRLDRQVKVAGVRMELDEIEAALRRHDAIADCAVVAVRAENDGTRRELVGHVVLHDGAPPVEELDGFLRDRLPTAMVPRRWQVHPALPVTANGKTDYRSLAGLPR
jgi:amino acid adenylation domain-containing protein